MHMFKVLVLSILLLVTTAVQAEVKISDAWVRESIPGQDIAAAYLTLKSPEFSKLYYVESPSAGTVEIHTMTMDNGVMKMRMLDELELKPNEAETLAPGGFHLMMFNLKEPLKAGSQVKFTLCFKDKAGNITHQDVMVPVKAPK
jgi:periplasmic copper chaperone A